MGGVYDSSLTRVQPFFEALVEMDPTGSAWLPALLACVTHVPEHLVGVLEQPGELISALLLPPAKGSAKRACYEAPAAPSKALLRWYVEHPQVLVWPASANRDSADTKKWRKALIEDLPPGRDAATERALAAIDANATSVKGWWRFEGVTRLDFLLATDRLVVTVEGKRTEGLSPATKWYPQRSQVVRNLEAAKGHARGRAWASIVMSEHKIPEASWDAVAASLDLSAPHLNDSERAELQAGYLGNLTWEDACQATGVRFGSFPKTTADLPGS